MKIPVDNSRLDSKEKYNDQKHQDTERSNDTWGNTVVDFFNRKYIISVE